MYKKTYYWRVWVDLMLLYIPCRSLLLHMWRQMLFQESYMLFECPLPWSRLLCIQCLVCSCASPFWGLAWCSRAGFEICLVLLPHCWADCCTSQGCVLSSTASCPICWRCIGSCWKSSWRYFKVCCQFCRICDRESCKHPGSRAECWA